MICAFSVISVMYIRDICDVIYERHDPLKPPQWSETSASWENECIAFPQYSNEVSNESLWSVPAKVMSFSKPDREKREGYFMIQIKVGQQTLVTTAPGVDFINVLRTAFTLVDPKSVKKIGNLTVFFTLLGSASVKAVRRTLMKLSPGRLNDFFEKVLYSSLCWHLLLVCVCDCVCVSVSVKNFLASHPVPVLTLRQKKLDHIVGRFNHKDKMLKLKSRNLSRKSYFFQFEK